MPEKVLFNLSSIDGFLFPQKTATPISSKPREERTSSYAEYPLKPETLFIQIGEKGIFWTVNSLYAGGCSIFLDAAYKYIERSKRQLLDGVVAEGQYTDALKGIGTALLFSNNVRKYDSESYVAVPVANTAGDCCEKIIVLKLTMRRGVGCAVEVHQVVEGGRDIAVEMYEDGKIIFINNSQGS